MRNYGWNVDLVFMFFYYDHKKNTKVNISVAYLISCCLRLWWCVYRWRCWNEKHFYYVIKYVTLLNVSVLYCETYILLTPQQMYCWKVINHGMTSLFWYTTTFLKDQVLLSLFIWNDTWRFKGSSWLPLVDNDVKIMTFVL